MSLSTAMSADTVSSTPMVSTAEDPRWHAIVRRDISQDGAFVYAVRTTGVYCRPGCPARLAKPENVTFHNTCAEAQRAGFRACLRCRPDTISPATQQLARVAEACRIIETTENLPSLKTLADAVAMSTFHFHRIFKATTGVTPSAYGRAHRAKRVRDRLSEGSASVTEVIYDAGFNSNGRFYAASDQMLGMTPTVFRAGGPDTTIHFAIGECSLGSILVAQSLKGICAILLGDDPDQLARDLQDRFPKADLMGGHRGFEAIVASVVGLVDGPATALDLPLDVRGTAFQQRVWQALRDIPVGSTASYAEIARRIGLPQAVRAVARACGANAIAVAIPCHRVVRTDGALSGYRWGVQRKRALLDKEAAATIERTDAP
ncbi:bifunctional DNA-binding transcriptional regulator/O6-methylguanine-DNA methyltransferase Ada [Lichenihabitans psoromatis]|uniref:bifunctional DNA-binding transcriptional regulator/O6-methylguanine-DNA methyltransferase Ada n=1 Tax=Lichenihabitans psoromatis TaxID=2528642 RepID=UPI001AECE09D